MLADGLKWVKMDLGNNLRTKKRGGKANADFTRNNEIPNTHK